MRCLIADLAGSRFCEKPNGRRAVSRVARVGILLLLWLVAGRASAQTLTTLASFNGNNGQYPDAGLTLSSDGNTLYGTTESDGTIGAGAVFSVPISGGNDFGTVFSVPVSGGSPTVLASLSGANGQYPYAGLTLSGNTLYGTTENGGVNADGAVFSVPISGGSITVLASFNGSNGHRPLAGLTLSGNALYGTTYEGGNLSLNGGYGDGTVFSVPLSGGTPTTLTSFSGSNGWGPYAGLTLSGNTLYGTTYAGGAYGYGVVFSVPLSGGSPTVLASFNGSNGEYLMAGVTVGGNTLYGTTRDGGANGYGTVFSVPLSGGSPTVLATFNGNNGKYPNAVTLSGNILYGTTYQGGTYGYGTVFALNIAPAMIALSSGTSATIISGGTATVGMTVSNAPSSGYNLNYTLNAAVLSGSATLGAITSGTGSLAPSASQSCTLPAASTTLGVSTISFTASDPNSSNGSQTTTATLTVLDHAAAAFANGSTTLNLNFGTLQVGSGTQSLQYQIENLPAAYRAGLDLDSVMVLSDSGGVFSTDASPFTDLAQGSMSNLFNLFLDTSQPGQFSGVYQFNLSDEQDLSGHAGQQTLTLDVTANVVPEASTLALLAAGALGLLGYGLRRRRIARTTKPSAFDQPHAPTILFFSSHSSTASAVRRAA